METKYNNTLLSIIDTLYKKIQELNILLWTTEQRCIELEKQNNNYVEQIQNLEECIQHRDNEILDITKILDKAYDESKYYSLLDIKEKMEKDLFILKEKFENITNLYSDIEYTL